MDVSVGEEAQDMLAALDKKCAAQRTVVCALALRGSATADQTRTMPNTFRIVFRCILLTSHVLNI